MKKITLEDVTQEAFDAVAETVISGIKAYNRKLDTRSGTVLRDLLVDPSAAIESVAIEQIDEVRRSSSLKCMKESQESGNEVDQEDVDSILSNFNIHPASGLRSAGIVKVVVSDGSIAYSVAQGTIFRTAENVQFSSDEFVLAANFEFANPSVKATTKLYKGSAGYFFLVPVTAVDAGSSGNIQEGTALIPNTTISSFVMSEAYKDFDGGADTPSLDAVIKSIPSGLSIRGFVNKTAVEGMLRDRFDNGDSPIVAVSAVGYGNLAQRRDKHNVFGVGVGGRVDVYVRNFTDATTDAAILKGTRGHWKDGEFVDEEGFYTIEVIPGTFPGACWIKSVSDPFGGSESDDVLSSLAFSAKRTADVSGTWHDFDRGNQDVEAFNTVWQGFSIELSDVPGDGGSDSQSERFPVEKEFKVTAYCMPHAVELQDFVDRDDVRSVSTDVVVRCPIVCSVSVNAVVKYDPKNPIDESASKKRIRSYINNLGFVGRITRSDIVQILKNLGAVSVEMPNKDMLYGSLHDANGNLHELSGDALDIQTIENGPSMLTKDTVIFVAEENNIQIKIIPNS